MAPWLIGMLPGAVSGLADFFTSKSNTDSTIAANKELANYQYSKDLDLWNKANEYNTPQAQMQRLSAAGLNPNLVYGSGVTGNVAGQLPKYNAPTVEYKYSSPASHAPAMLQQYLSLQTQKAQLDNLKAQTESVHMRTANDAINNQILSHEATYRGDLLHTKRESGLTSLDLQRSISPYQLDYSRNRTRAVELDNQNRLLNVANQPTRLSQENQRRAAEILFRNYENELNKFGVNRSDHVLLRGLVRSFSTEQIKRLLNTK